MAWTDLSGAFGYGTKLTSTQMQNLRDNLAAMAAGDSGAPSIVEAALADSAVAQAKLKTGVGDVSECSNDTDYHNKTLPGGEYGFYPQIKRTSSSNGITAMISVAHESLTYVTNIALKEAAASVNCIYAQQRYVTSSGEVHWIFILRDKISKKIRSMWQAPDHPCFGNGGKPLLVPHPFYDYEPTKHDIVVINPTPAELAEIRAKQIQSEDKPDKCLIEVILEDYQIDEASKPEWPKKEVTVGLPPDWHKAWQTGQPVTPIKKQIPKMDYILCRKLKKIK